MSHFLLCLCCFVIFVCIDPLLVDAQAYTIVGSFADGPSPRAMNLFGPTRGFPTLEKCVAKCFALNATYAGYQDPIDSIGVFQGGQCSCSNSLEETQQYGTGACGTYRNQHCDCVPRKGSIIGGSDDWCNFVVKINYTWRNRNYVVAKGSYGDSFARAMRFAPTTQGSLQSISGTDAVPQSGYTLEACVAACSPKYRFVALQNGVQPGGEGECYCDDDWSHVTSYGTESCGENQGSHCDCAPAGGTWCNFVYELVAAEKLGRPNPPATFKDAVIADSGISYNLLTQAQPSRPPSVDTSSNLPEPAPIESTGQTSKSNNNSSVLIIIAFYSIGILIIAFIMLGAWIYRRVRRGSETNNTTDDDDHGDNDDHSGPSATSEQPVDIGNFEGAEGEEEQRRGRPVMGVVMMMQRQQPYQQVMRGSGDDDDAGSVELKVSEGYQETKKEQVSMCEAV